MLTDLTITIRRGASAQIPIRIETEKLKALELQRFAGETKVTTEQHVVYAVMIDISNPEAPRAIIHSRDQITAPSGNVVHGESKQTVAPLYPTAPPFSKATARGGCDRRNGHGRRHARRARWFLD